MDVREESFYAISEYDKYTALSPLPSKGPIVDCTGGLLILGRWRTDQLDHTVFEKEY